MYFDQALNCARIPKSAIHEDDGTEPGNESKNDSGQEETTEELQETEPLAVILINSVFHLLFLPGLTLSVMYIYISLICSCY